MLSDFFICETAFSHEGDYDYLLQQVILIGESNLKVIKFQILLDPTSYFHPSSSRPDWCFSLDAWRDIFNFARQYGLEIVGLPLDLMALNFCMDMGVEAIEIHPVMVSDMPFIRYLSEKYTGEVILGISGVERSRLDHIIDLFDRPIILMLGFQSFPTHFLDSNLFHISNLRSDYPRHSLGFADHSSHDSLWAFKLPELAVALGVRYIEKHFVLEKGRKRIDFDSALNIEDLSDLRQSLSCIFDLKNSTNGYKFSRLELQYANRRKIAHSSKLILPGQIITDDCLVWLSAKYDDNLVNRPEDVVGRICLKPIRPLAPVRHGDLK